MSVAILADTAPADWKYVSEGGATIVFSYIGAARPQFDGTVLRLRKTTVPSLAIPLHGSGYGSGRSEEQDEPDDPMIEFQKRCMERLIPQAHLPRLESVRLSPEWLMELSALHDAERPLDRREKDHIDLARKKGVLATDLVGGDWVAVEIKPKWAFLPSPTHLSEATRATKAQTCRFCMHSQMKASQGETVSLGYCPLDLFSADKARITNAIHSLWDAWQVSDGKVNNLKVFVRGKKIRPSEANLMLLSPAGNTENLRGAFTAALLPLLTETPILRVLSKLQRTLDVLDIEGLAKLWHLAETSAPSRRTAFSSFSVKSPVAPTTPSFPNISALPTSPLGVSSAHLSSPDPTISDWSTFLDDYLSGTQLNHSEPSPENLRHYILAYLLSATFKDCSIILRTDPLQPGVAPGAVKADRVTVIDLDPKSMDRLRTWEKLDREIVSAYVGVKPKRCIDGWVE